MAAEKSHNDYCIPTGFSVNTKIDIYVKKVHVFLCIFIF